MIYNIQYIKKIKVKIVVIRKKQKMIILIIIVVCNKIIILQVFIDYVVNMILILVLYIL